MLSVSFAVILNQPMVKLVCYILKLETDLDDVHDPVLESEQDVQDHSEHMASHHSQAA